MLVHDTPTAIAWLREWLPEGPWCLASIDPDKTERVPLVVFTDLVAAERWIEDRQGKLNLYFTVNTPVASVTTTPTKEEIAGLNCFHIDIDLPKTGPYAAPTTENFQHHLRIVRRFYPEPTAITFSGGGYQAFWLFPATLSATPELRERIEAVNINLEKLAGGDHCHNVNRLMRLPGTINLPNAVKRSRGRTPALAYIVEAHWDRRWSFEHDPSIYLTEDLNEAPPATAHVISALPRDVQKRIISGDASGYKSRSELLWAIIHKMIRLEWTDDEIRPIFLNSDHKISEHCFEQAHPTRYIDDQIRKARAKAAEDFKRNPKTDAILSTDQDNLRKAIEAIGAKFEEDTFVRRIYLNGVGPRRLLEDIESTDLRWTIDTRFGFNPPKPVFDDFLTFIAHKNQRHPVREYLDALVHDGVPRIGSPDSPSWLTTLGGAEDSPYTRAVGRLILVASVRRIRSPGCKFDEMLVLISAKQGTNKSTAVQELCADQSWFSANLQFGAKNQEVQEQLSGKWLLEFSELSGMRTSQVEHLKAFMSRQSDRARMAYGHFPVEALRQCVFFGTTNELFFLRDNENRRFWPVRVIGFAAGAVAAVRDQLWAEAALAEATGESIRLDPELYDAAAGVQAQHRAPEPWADILADALGEMTGRLVSSDLVKLINKPGHMATQEDTRRLAAAMREIGWEHAVARHGGRPKNCYVRGGYDEQKRQLFVFVDPVTMRAAVSENPDPSEYSPTTDRTVDEEELPF